MSNTELVQGGCHEIVHLISVAIALVVAYSIQASEDSMGPNGINSIGLGLDGMGVAIGQNEWRENFGNTSGSGSFAAVPEPGSAMLLMVAGVMVGMRWRAWR